MVYRQFDIIYRMLNGMYDINLMTKDRSKYSMVKSFSHCKDIDTILQFLSQISKYKEKFIFLPPNVDNLFPFTFNILGE